MKLEEAIQKTKEEWESNPQLKQDRDEVIAKYGEIFKLENIDNLTQEKFQEFLRFENNKHWSKLDRPGGSLIKDMDKLKSALKILLDESQPLSSRIKRIRDTKGKDYTPFLAQAIYTPILLVTNPQKYPVVNLPVAEALDELGLYPIKKWTSGEEEWDSIPQMQQIVQDVATKNDLDLWQVDWVWWKIARGADPIEENSATESPLLKFLKEKMITFSNFQPIVIKTLLEKGDESAFTATIQEIREKIQELNFDRDEFLNDAIRSSKGALKDYVTFTDQNASLDLDKFSSSDIQECLKLCGQRIAWWHVYKIVKNELDVWHIIPGSRDDNFPYLDEFLNTNSIGVGWAKIGDVSNLSEEKILQEFKNQYPDGEGKSFLAFTKITKKDVVVLVRGQEEIINFGIVVGDYYHKEVKKPSYPHRKNVVWLNQGPINSKDLPTPTLSGMRATCGKLIQRNQEMIGVLLGKQSLAAVKAHSCFNLTQNQDSEYADIEGKQYQYDNQKANWKRFIIGSKFVIQSKIDNENYFTGFGKIGTIESNTTENEQGKSITQFIAKFSEYQKFATPKVRTKEILDEMKSLPEHGSQPPSILPIPRKLYSKITGQDLVDSDPEEAGMVSSKSSELLEEKKQIIFYGPPGTGKTRAGGELARSFVVNNVLPERNFETTGSDKIVQKPGIRSLTDDQYHKEVLERIGEEGEKEGYTLSKENNNEHLYSLKKNGNEIRIIVNFSHSSTTSDDIYVGVTQNMVDFLLVVSEHNRYQLIINDLEKNFLILPYQIQQKYARFVSSSEESGRWDETGRNQHAFHVSISKDGAELPVRGDDRSNLDCDRFVRNIKMMFGNFIQNITFHPSYSYEEFVEGIRPGLNTEHLSYEMEDGIFKTICNDARNDIPQNKYVLFIDEINRGNISKIFGELITLIENDKRETHYSTLTYTKESFTVPKNLYIIGTMNTANKSLVLLDVALRRRFGFIELMPDYSVIDHEIDVEGSKFKLDEILENLNDKIRKRVGRERQIGHSYFMKKDKPIETDEQLQSAFVNDIIPLLQEYLYEDYRGLHDILGDGFVGKDKEEIILAWKKDMADFKKALEKIPKDE